MANINITKAIEKIRKTIGTFEDVVSKVDRLERAGHNKKITVGTYAAGTFDVKDLAPEMSEALFQSVLLKLKNNQAELAEIIIEAASVCGWEGK